MIFFPQPLLRHPSHLEFISVHNLMKNGHVGYQPVFHRQSPINCFLDKHFIVGVELLSA